MSRLVVPGEPVIDQFPAFEFDGYSRRSGLLWSDFLVTTFFNGAVQAVTAFISEIGSTGNYKVQFTPPVAGFWIVEVLIDFNKDIWSLAVDAAYTDVTGIIGRIEKVQEQVDKIDLAATLGPATVVSGSLMDRLMNGTSSKTYNQGTDSLEAIRNRLG